jgi:hypothetical protein
MKKHHKRRLVLNSDTIRQLEIKELAPDRLRTVVGGITDPVLTSCSTEPR